VAQKVLEANDMWSMTFISLMCIMAGLMGLSLFVKP
jgi:hypothetical protein